MIGLSLFMILLTLFDLISPITDLISLGYYIWPVKKIPPTVGSFFLKDPL